MKKSILFVGLATTIMFMSSCGGKYYTSDLKNKDWKAVEYKDSTGVFTAINSDLNFHIQLEEDKYESKTKSSKGKTKTNTTTYKTYTYEFGDEYLYGDWEVEQDTLLVLMNDENASNSKKLPILKCTKDSLILNVEGSEVLFKGFEVKK